MRSYMVVSEKQATDELIPACYISVKIVIAKIIVENGDKIRFSREDKLLVFPDIDKSLTLMRLFHDSIRNSQQNMHAFYNDM